MVSSAAPAVGDRDAEFSEYMAARQPSLLRTAYLLTGDRHTAEDLVQTALAKLYLSWDKVQRQRLAGRLRPPHPRQRAQLAVAPVLEEARDHDLRAARGGRRAGDRPGHDADLWALVQTLPRKQRAAVVLRYYEELSEAETAAVLGVSVGTVKSQTSRALAALRTRVGDRVDNADLASQEER